MLAKQVFDERLVSVARINCKTESAPAAKRSFVQAQSLLRLDESGRAQTRASSPTQNFAALQRHDAVSRSVMAGVF